MKWYDYIREKKGLLAVCSFGAFFPGLFMSVSTKTIFSWAQEGYCALILTVLFALYFLLDYRKQKKYVMQLEHALEDPQLEFVLSLPRANTKERKLFMLLLLQEKRNAKRQLQTFEEAKAEDMDFIEAWVHEIKTPIVAAKLILAHYIDEPSEEVMYEVGDEIAKIEDMVQKTICYSELNAFSRDCQLQNVSLKKVINQCLKTEFANIRNKKCRVEIEAVDFELCTDPKWLSFIVKQLLDNAIKFSNEGGRIQIVGSDEGYHQKLQIIDDGIGIQKQDLRFIFEKGYTGRNGRRLENTTGVGLYLSQKLAAKLGYEIQIDSTPQKGCCVTIFFQT